MRPLIIAMGLYIGMMSWMLYNGHRTTTAVHEAMTTIGFDYYLEYVSAFDQKKSTPRRREIEAWAMQVDPQTIDAVNVRRWVKWMQGRTVNQKKR